MTIEYIRAIVLRSVTRGTIVFIPTLIVVGNGRHVRGDIDNVQVIILVVITIRGFANIEQDKGFLSGDFAFACVWYQVLVE